ncbi:hypothetical protein [Pseudomonas lundensis]|uniref:hypothetical protein n=1 Tax=Pseudomonas lundensis TaxID=86185 RepID=UPI0014744BF9|nr:hypothetical protein [Pseudomonas lundensis]
MNALSPDDFVRNALLKTGRFSGAWKFTLPRRISHQLDLKLGKSRCAVLVWDTISPSVGNGT